MAMGFSCGDAATLATVYGRRQSLVELPRRVQLAAAYGPYEEPERTEWTYLRGTIGAGDVLARHDGQHPHARGHEPVAACGDGVLQGGVAEPAGHRDQAAVRPERRGRQVGLLSAAGE